MPSKKWAVSLARRSSATQLIVMTEVENCCSEPNISTTVRSGKLMWCSLTWHWARAASFRKSESTAWRSPRTGSQTSHQMGSAVFCGNRAGSSVHRARTSARRMAEIVSSNAR